MFHASRSVRLASIVVLLAGVPLACAPAGEVPEVPANPLVGAWTLVSWESTAPDGTVNLPYNGNAEGQITYTATGRMSAQLMERDREFPDAADVSGAEAYSAVLGGFFSYYGRYSIDDENDIVTHHVEGALAPAWVGSDRPRSFTFDGPDRITLSTEPDPNRGGGSIGVLVWERITGG